MLTNRMWPCSAHDAFVTVSEYRCGAMEGYLTHPRFGAPLPIKSISHLLRLLDQAQSLENVPYKPENYAGTVYENPNKIASFTISVLFQQHHSLQGKLTWHEQAMEATFRSALELIYLMDDILTAKTDEREGMNHD